MFLLVYLFSSLLSVFSSDPVSRLVSVSELVSRQNLACASHLSWSTNQQRAWVREAELSLPGNKALPRVNLLLIGCLREGRGGEWRLMDSSGSIRCEVSLMVGVTCDVMRSGSEWVYGNLTS